ncbi:MAG: DUF4357 domain-containing protein [Candidatus Dojkabacteria bacterium]|nr:DUF4357 domain-containing protein [Candidatus Dojkabacteria bacterium]
MVFTSKDDNLTKAHVKYLESKIVQQIKNNNTVKLQNENVPPLPKLPRTDIHQMDEFYENMKILASALGFTFLENFNDKLDEQEEILYCKGKNYDAIGLYTDEGFIILEGSIVSGKHSPSFEKYEYGRLKRREKTIEDGSLVPEENGNNVVKRKLIFSSPSAASGFVKGGATNGWLHWKNKDGKTLDELKRRRS